MFWDNWFKKDVIGEPVLTLVERVKENPRMHRLEMIGDHHLMFYYNGDYNWDISISHKGRYLYACSTAEWMNRAEKIYVFNELVNYAGGDKYTRQGWMQKVFPEER